MTTLALEKALEGIIADAARGALAAEVAPLVDELRQLREAIEALRSNAPEPEPEMLYATAAAFAERLGVSERTIRKLVAEGMPHRRVGRRLRIPIRQAEQWLDQREAERRAAAEERRP